MAEKLDPALLVAIKKVTRKRPRTVIDHILQHGFISTEDLKEKYGYDHPPRAARDVREEGIPLETFKVRGAHGRMIAAYKFGNPRKIEEHKLGGRRAFSKDFKNSLYDRAGGRCACCYQRYEKLYLQVDHRVPYEVAGERSAREADASKFMLLCASCQRRKSWSCEHCRNWKEIKKAKICETCFWASPEKYDHIAMTSARRLELVWLGRDVAVYDDLKKMVKGQSFPMSEMVKEILRKAVEDS